MSSELEQARPQTSGEEELQLQLALAMSREVAEQVGARVGFPKFVHAWRVHIFNSYLIILFSGSLALLQVCVWGFFVFFFIIIFILSISF